MRPRAKQTYTLKDSTAALQYVRARVLSTHVNIQLQQPVDLELAISRIFSKLVRVASPGERAPEAYNSV